MCKRAWLINIRTTSFGHATFVPYPYVSQLAMLLPFFVAMSHFAQSRHQLADIGSAVELARCVDP
jgi:hypothetical protein